MRRVIVSVSTGTDDPTRTTLGMLGAKAAALSRDKSLSF